MNKLEMMVAKINKIEQELNLDLTDLRLIVFAEERWAANRDVRVTDFIGAGAASPATIFYRVSKALVQQKWFKLKPNPEDAREKLVLPGPRYKSLEKYL
jgi:hypothetical protein